MIQEETPKAFKFLDFKIPKFSVDICDEVDYKIKMSFKPSGKYYQNTGKYELNFLFEAIDDTSKDILISVNAFFLYEFDKPYKFSELPDYFFTNSIPIGFPYLRAFISNITLQANLEVIMLDLIKFSNTSKPLKENTDIISD